jgi:cytochrome P450
MRRQRLARNPNDVPEGLLTLLLNALDPDTGRRMTEAEVRSNILTFIAAGHETTANCLSWSLSCCLSHRSGRNRSLPRPLMKSAVRFPSWPIDSL